MLIFVSFVPTGNRPHHQLGNQERNAANKHLQVSKFTPYRLRLLKLLIAVHLFKEAGCDSGLHRKTTSIKNLCTAFLMCLFRGWTFLKGPTLLSVITSSKVLLLDSHRTVWNDSWFKIIPVILYFKPGTRDGLTEVLPGARLRV